MGLGLHAHEISLLNSYPPHMDVIPAHSVSAPHLLVWIFVVSLILELSAFHTTPFGICQTSIQLDF